MRPPRVLIAASEAAPFARVGGLADVSSGLTRALTRLGADARLILPRYGSLQAPESLRWRLDLGWIPLEVYPFRASLWEGELPGSSAPVYCVESADFFSRAGIYGDPATGRDFADNFQRFVFFMKAVLQACQSLGWFPDVLHCNDWQTGLLPAYLRVFQEGASPWAGTRSLFTIHNLAYQGRFDTELFKLTDLPRHFGAPGGPAEHLGKLNLLKAAILQADTLTTVSPSYATEIQNGPEYARGMESELRLRRADLFGVLNGIDLEEWNPVTDPLIPERYSSQRLRGKDTCKAELQRGAGLPADQKIPVIGMVTRLVEQKGIDLLLEALPELIALEAQWFLLGEGDGRYHEALAAAARMHPGRLSVSLKFDPALAHRVQAGSDMFLMPSRYEPCGLTQMYALRYGTVPVVRHTGGLADTVRDAHQDPDGNGFKFHTYSARELVETVKRALWTFRQSSAWRQIMRRGMAEDFSWERSAGRYLELYARTRPVP